MHKHGIVSIAPPSNESDISHPGYIYFLRFRSRRQDSWKREREGLDVAQLFFNSSNEENIKEGFLSTKNDNISV